MCQIIIKTNKKYYTTNLTDKYWQFIEKIAECQKRKRKDDLRDIMNAIVVRYSVVVFLSFALAL